MNLEVILQIYYKSNEVVINLYYKSNMNLEVVIKSLLQV